MSGQLVLAILQDEWNKRNGWGPFDTADVARAVKQRVDDIRAGREATALPPDDIPMTPQTFADLIPGEDYDRARYAKRSVSSAESSVVR
jgi:hypothetical protein